MLVTPRSKKSLDFLSNFNFMTKRLTRLGKYVEWVVNAGYL